MAFQIFKQGHREYPDSVVVLYPSNKKFAFMSSDVDKLPDTDHFEYLTDPKEMLLGFEPVDEPTDNSYKADRSEYTVRFSAAAVIREFGVNINDLEEPVPLPIEKDGDRVVADLSELA